MSMPPDREGCPKTTNRVIGMPERRTVSCQLGSQGRARRDFVAPVVLRHGVMPIPAQAAAARPRACHSDAGPSRAVVPAVPSVTRNGGPSCGGI